MKIFCIDVAFTGFYEVLYQVLRLIQLICSFSNTSTFGVSFIGESDNVDTNTINDNDDVGGSVSISNGHNDLIS